MEFVDSMVKQRFLFPGKLHSNQKMFKLKIYQIRSVGRLFTCIKYVISKKEYQSKLWKNL